MDVQSYDAFDQRLQYLHTLLSASTNAPPVLKQLENLNREINQVSTIEFQNLFNLLKNANLWNQLPSQKSQIVENKDTNNDDIRNIVISGHQRLLDFLRNFENVVELAELMNKLVQSTSSKYQDLLSVKFPEQDYNQLVSNYSKLLVRSMLLLERDFKFLVRENEYWSSIESSLREIESKVSSISEIKKKETKYVS